MANSSDNQVAEKARARRSIAVISHPDAGKSTLTEALLLHASAIGEAGAVHGKAGRRGTVSDWMDMERARGISVNSTVIQFPFHDAVINLVDTPGHADFSEDTFRVLTAVDAAIMLVDASKGLEAQTMKLFDVCRERGLPVITFINKWDRPGKEALALVDEIADRTGLRSMPKTWPIGEAGFFHGLLDPQQHTMQRFRRTPGGTTKVIADELSDTQAESAYPDEWATAKEEASLLEADEGFYDRESFLSQEATPMFFGSAVQNIGIEDLLGFIADEAPYPGARKDVMDQAHPVDGDFSAYVFKIQTGMDRAHRDQIAFARVCSGVFERGMVATHAQTGKPFATKYAQKAFGRERETVDTAWPGDVVGLVNASALRPGDTLYEGQSAVTYPRLPHFAPEHFREARCADAGKHKQFRRGIHQLGEEGIVQVLHSERRGAQHPVLGAVGPMQFDVVVERMSGEFNAPITLDVLDYTFACQIDHAAGEALTGHRDCEVVMREDGTLLGLFPNPWKLRSVKRQYPEITLEPMRGIADQFHHSASPQR
ncbi:peptide chain release factor 3 [Nesterenkonia haasae]|uniref:peptide chain release factor 3 n=1 Tax=Nesterenkonia haasae TaxID=2587813 RepID=UPI001391C1C6|nr:peptide chain release factor 3 [Nesterenkonia haasae]NDK30270.1 peptide chain release factor 3 [Nesterenkonia haasae]